MVSKSIVIFFSLFLTFLAHAKVIPQESNIFGKGWDGKMIEIEGYIADEPKFSSFNKGKSQSYSFRVNATGDYNEGDEFILVTFHTVKWGKKVGEFNGAKGDKVNLTGKYNEHRKGRTKTGIVGSLAVNDKSNKEVE